ncbi:MAG: hypothetical protein ABIP94_24640 [Planctomycetota bacterium]
MYQWDPVPQGTGDPFGKWYAMPDLEAARWYPTVSNDGSLNGGIVIGGTNWTPVAGTQAVNSYEVVRTVFNAQPIPLLSAPNGFHFKANGATFPSWATPTTSSSDRQFWGPQMGSLGPGFGDYPRINLLGVLDNIAITNPTSTVAAPRFFVSGFLSYGIRWGHVPPARPDLRGAPGTRTRRPGL